MSLEFAARQRSPNVREADLEQLELPADDAATARGVILAVALIPHDVPAAVDRSRLATHLGDKLLCVVLPAG